MTNRLSDYRQGLVPSNLTITRREDLLEPAQGRFKPLVVPTETGRLTSLTLTMPRCELFHLTLRAIAGFEFLDNRLHFLIRKIEDRIHFQCPELTIA